MIPFALSVPANLLLVGEYAVTEEGGLGIAMAATPRVRIAAEGSAGLVIKGCLGPTGFEWQAADPAPEPPPLVAACLVEASRFLEAAMLPTSFEELRIDIDSSAFFAPDGSKRGYGSSAAVAVGLVAALLRAGGLEGQPLEEAVFPVALSAHRRSQGGRGSGYDVAASRFGGLGLFTGGAKPTWRQLAFSSLPALFLFQGPAPVSSSAAVGRYAAWKRSQPAGQAAFLARSNATVDAFLANATGPALLSALEAAARLGIEVGDTIGVPARLAAPGGTPEGTVTKALGAGNELGLIALPPSASSKLVGGLEALTGLTPVEAAPEGLRWE